MVKKEPQPVHVMPGYMNFAIGGTSGLLAIAIVQPADLLKTRMQLMGPAGRNLSALTVARDIVAREEIVGFYRGLSAALFRQASYTAGRLGVFNALFDMQKAITREEGITTLWRGTGATVSRAQVVNGAQLSTYAQSREMLLPYMGDGLHLHTVTAMIAGFVTTVASLPIDIVKTRVQNAETGASQMAVLSTIIEKEGLLALWRGMLPTYMKIGPMTILTFIFLEQLNLLYYKIAT